MTAHSEGKCPTGINPGKITGLQECIVGLIRWSL